MSKIHINEEEFNWGGFLIPQIWCIGNGVPIGYLSYVPILAPFIAIYLGFNGSRLAYERQSWKYSNLDEFYKVQRRWTIAGIIIVLLTISFFAFLKKDNIYNLYNNRQEYRLIMENADSYKKLEENTAEEVKKIIQSESFKQCLGDYNIDSIRAYSNSQVEEAEEYRNKSLIKRSKTELKYEKGEIENVCVYTYNTDREKVVWWFEYDNNELDNIEYHYYGRKDDDSQTVDGETLARIVND